MVQMKIFVVPLEAIENSESELNSFLRSRKIIKVESQFSTEGYWTFCVRYSATSADDKKAKQKPKFFTKQLALSSQAPQVA